MGSWRPQRIDAGRAQLERRQGQRAHAGRTSHRPVGDRRAAHVGHAGYDRISIHGVRRCPSQTGARGRSSAARSSSSPARTPVTGPSSRSTLRQTHPPLQTLASVSLEDVRRYREVDSVCSASRVRFRSGDGRRANWPRSSSTAGSRLALSASTRPSSTSFAGRAFDRHLLADLQARRPGAANA